MRGVGAIHEYRRKGKDLYMQALQKYNTHLGLSFFFVALSEQKVQTFSESKRINVIRYIYEYDLDY